MGFVVSLWYLAWRYLSACFPDLSQVGGTSRTRCVQGGFQGWQQAVGMGGQTSKLGRQGKAVLDDMAWGLCTSLLSLQQH